ncbi:MAG: hypothetical protein QGG42_10515 [Phycisphaerae bacterium]|jgi:glutathione synthase/RimK-type ligase-like ATP-grasp enzyme|nr:hypothetical protein [Phycisphaerae bacterium]
MEHEWSEAIEGFFASIPRKRWINHPAYNAIASSKLEQLTRASRFGLSVPDTILTRDPVVASRKWSQWKGAMVIKPLSPGEIKRADASDGLLYTRRVKADDVKEFSLLPKCPTLLQQAVDKRVDVRVTVVDSDIHAVELSRRDDHGTQLQDIRRDNMTGVEYTHILIPEDVENCLLKLLRSYSLRFAAVDFVIDRLGEWYFLEINPNGQWAWLDLAGGTRISDSFIQAFRSDKTQLAGG